MRPSKWGNPFKIGKDGSREEVINKYREWLMSKPKLIFEAKRELKGKDLLCCCAPKSCHGDILLEVANENDYNSPPCQDCGAMTIEEAEKLCKCGGDKDHCHGCDLWPD